MAPQAGTPPHGWRQRLFGSLLGQLRLAAFTTVFLGFTAASAFTLLINQQCLLRQQQAGQRQAASTLTAWLDQIGSDPSPANTDQLRLELDRRSVTERLFWVERGDGSLLLPEAASSEATVSPRLVELSMASYQDSSSRRSWSVLAGDGSLPI